MKINVERLPTLVVEAIAIVFSVLLALGVNEWRQSMNDRALVKRVLSSLRTETIENKKQIQAALAHHEALIKDIRETKHTKYLLSIDLQKFSVNPKHFNDLRALIRNNLENFGLPLAQQLTMVKETDNRYLLIFADTDLVGTIEVSNQKVDIYAPKGIPLKSAFIRNNAWEVAIATQATIHLDYAIVAQMSELHNRHQRYEETVSTILNMLYNQKFKLSPLEDLLNAEKQLLKKYDTLLETIDPIL